MWFLPFFQNHQWFWRTASPNHALCACSLISSRLHSLIYVTAWVKADSSNNNVSTTIFNLWWNHSWWIRLSVKIFFINCGRKAQMASTGWGDWQCTKMQRSFRDWPQPTFPPVFLFAFPFTFLPRFRPRLDPNQTLITELRRTNFTQVTLTSYSETWHWRRDFDLPI